MKPGWLRILPAPLRTRLEGRLNLQKILANTGWLFGDRILRLGVGLVVGIWVARYLGAEQYGIYNYALAFVSLFGVLATLGLDTIAVRDLVRDPARQDVLLGTVFGLKVIGAVVACLTVTAAISVQRPADGLMRLIVFLLASGLVFQAFDAIDFWFQSCIQSRYTVIARNTAFLTTAVIRVLLIQLQAPLLAFVIAGLVEVGLGAVGLVVAYQRQGGRIRAWRFDTGCAGQLLRESWPLILSGLAIMIYMRIDLIMLGELVNDRAVGVYAAATRLSELWYFIPTAIVSSVFPSIIEARKRSEAEYYRRLQQLFDVVAGLALVIAVPMTALSSWVIHVLYATEYAAAGPILAVHIWAAVFVFLGVAQSPWDVAEGLTRLSLMRTVIGAVVNVGLNLLLLPAYGGLGAAVATVVAYACSACLANALSGRTHAVLRLQLRALFPIHYLTSRVSER
jgi:PST family polysaccharide transporter